MDTHVIVEAAKQGLAKSSGPESRLFDLILARCPVIVLTPALIKELKPHLRKLGIRFPQQLPSFLQRLDRHGDRKLRKLQKSKIAPLSAVRRKAFARSLSDDVHLYEATRACVGVVITCDRQQDAAARAILGATGVEVVYLGDLVGQG